MARLPLKINKRSREWMFLPQIRGPNCRVPDSELKAGQARLGFGPNRFRNDPVGISLEQLRVIPTAKTLCVALYLVLELLF